MHPESRAGGDNGPPYASLDDVWTHFDATFSCVGGLIHYAPVSAAYIEHAIATYAADGIQHLELRHVIMGNIGLPYNLDGTLHTSDEVISMYQRLSDEAVAAAALLPRGVSSLECE